LKALPIVGVASSVVGFTRSILDSSQAGKEFTIAIKTGSEATNSFFSALGTGDWSAFHNGILDAVSNADNLIRTLGRLANIDMANALATSDYGSALAYARSIMRDEEVAIEDKEEALKELARTQEVAMRINNDYIETTKAAIV
jgi:hypothetical protein